MSVAGGGSTIAGMSEECVARDQVVTLHLAHKDDTPPQAIGSGGVCR